MNRLKKILQSIRIEEYILLSFVITLYIVLYIFLKNYYSTTTSLEGNFSVVDFFYTGFKVVAAGTKFFLGVLMIFIFYFFFRLYLKLANLIYPVIEKKISLKKQISLKECFIYLFKTIKNFFVFLLIIIRPFLAVFLFFGMENLLLGFLAVYFRGALIDGWLMQFDRTILGFYPFMGSYYQEPILMSLISFLIIGYLLLGIIMSLGWVIFFFAKKRKLFSQYVIALSLGSMIGLLIWMLIPANSPRHLNNIYYPERIVKNYDQKKIDNELSVLLENSEPASKINNFHDSLGITREDHPPISTIPSMHIVWAIIIVYYFYLFNQRTLYFTLPWFFFSSLGAVYTGQHYFVDVIFSFPIAVIAIYLANISSRLSRLYYQKNKLDQVEEKAKQQVKKDLKILTEPIKYTYRFFRDIFV